VTLDEKALAAMPRVTVQAASHGDAPSAWEGVALVEVLRADADESAQLVGADSSAMLFRKN